MKKLWDLEENEISGSIYEELKAKYQDRWKREKPKKFMQSWIKDLEQEGNPKLQNLADMAVFYPDIRAFLDAVLLGEEGDLKRCGGRSISGDAVSLMTLHLSLIHIYYRLKEAALLLVKTEKKIATISDEAGFHNVDYLDVYKRQGL